MFGPNGALCVRRNEEVSDHIVGIYDKTEVWYMLRRHCRSFE